MSTASSGWKIKLSEKGKAVHAMVPTGDFIAEMNGKQEKSQGKREPWESYFAKIICDTKAIELVATPKAK